MQRSKVKVNDTLSRKVLKGERERRDITHRSGDGVGDDGFEEGEDSRTRDGSSLLHIVQDLGGGAQTLVDYKFACCMLIIVTVHVRVKKFQQKIAQNPNVTIFSFSHGYTRLIPRLPWHVHC